MRSTSSSYIGGIGDKGRRYMGGAKGGIKTYEQPGSLYITYFLSRWGIPILAAAAFTRALRVRLTE